jgi:ferrochelatase
MSKVGVLLINLGTPDHADPKSVRAYLKQFLNDARIVDLPAWVRYFLVNFFVIPFRYKKSAHAYQQIWMAQGSPLLVHSKALLEALKKELGDDVQIELGMRYGNPSMESAMRKLKSCQKIIAVPLFPQYSSAATGSAMAELFRVLDKQWNMPTLHLMHEFYQQPAFIESYAQLIQEKMTTHPVDAVIFSYHGLPERHIHKSECQKICHRSQPCPTMMDSNAYCYRAQCYETSRLIAQKLQLKPSQYHVSFQSRLGRTPWVQPYTDVLTSDLIKNKVKNIAIVCPSFVADCLETLEEIDIRAREQWMQAGGENFIFIPCLNTTPHWVRGLGEMIKNQLA